MDFFSRRAVRLTFLPEISMPKGLVIDATFGRGGKRHHGIVNLHLTNSNDGASFVAGEMES